MQAASLNQQHTHIIMHCILYQQVHKSTLLQLTPGCISILHRCHRIHKKKPS